MGEVLMDKFSYRLAQDVKEKVDKKFNRVQALKSQEFYSSPILESVNASDSTVKIHSLTTADVFGFYDDLMAAYPNYITREIFATETSGKAIYRYNFTPLQPEITRDETLETDLLHFFIVSGVHASEKAGWWCLYESMKQICENWRSHENLEALRYNVRFSVVPIVNVYGVDNSDDPVTLNGKKNANGVDINRNFPEGFKVISDTSYAGYGGEEPLSQPESIAIADVLRNEQVDFYADFHNFSSQPNVNYFMWGIGGVKRDINISQSYLSHISSKWKKENSSYPQEDDVFFGFSSTGAGGSTPPYVGSLGIQGGIFEICHTLHFLSTSQYTSEVITNGTEAQLNWLYINYLNLLN